jgi:mannose-1-phosphate guanylyltransferase
MFERAWVVVMAGGVGTRFWPRSRRSYPKQCLALTGARSLLQVTLDRVAALIPAERVLVVTGPDMAATVRAQLPELPPDNVLVEPSGRNTAPCIGWAAVEVARRGGELMAVLPSDHGIEDVEGFQSVLAACFTAAAASSRMVLLGQTPTSPHTGYGYLGVGAPAGSHGGQSFFAVERFIEKPSRERAEALLAAGGVLWNGGMFVWTVAAIREAFRRHLPRSAAALARMDGGAAVESVWTELEATSIDFGVLEHCGGELLAVACDFGWSDLGSFSAVAERMPSSELGVATVAAGVALDGGAHIVHAPGKLVATVGVSDLLIVDTDDVLLVCRTQDASRIPELLRELRARGMADYL